MDHKWPTSKDEHLWGPWMPYSKKQQYRMCTHPGCKAVQYKDAPL